MKRIATILLTLLLLLGGCSAEPEETAAPTTVTGPTEPGLYVPESAVEQATNGAVRSFGPVGGQEQVLKVMGNDILLFVKEEDGVSVTRLTGNNGRPAYTVKLADCYRPQVDNNALACYSLEEGGIVFLDAMLQKTDVIPLPEEMAPNVVISSDLKRAYYCVGNEVRYTELDSGISGLLRSQADSRLIPWALAASDRALVCMGFGESGEHVFEYISTADGRTLASSPELELTAHENAHFAQLAENGYWDFLFGKTGEEAKAFYPAENSAVYPLLSQGLALGALVGEGSVTLDLYDLESGHRIAAQEIPGAVDICSPVVSADGKRIWLVAQWEGRSQLLQWEFALSAVVDDTQYMGQRFAPDSPDTKGLEACRKRAQSLSDTYGLSIQLWDMGTAPEGYTFQSHYRTEALESTLDELEAILPMFPEDFFGMLEDGKLTVQLVCDIAAASPQADPEQESLAYWIDGRGCIALAGCENAAESFCGALSNILDAHIYAGSLKYDDWDSLNPQGFAYDGDYASYESRGENKWLEGEQRAFVDSYSMTFAREDRSRIFTLAMEEGNEAVFAAPAMQKKLARICAAIRDAFDWKKDERSFTWEQYLAE